MTAKQKANELINQHLNVKNIVMHIVKEETLHNVAIQNSIITVDEMIKQLPFTDLSTYIGKWCEQQRQFLNKVKDELLKLKHEKNKLSTVAS